MSTLGTFLTGSDPVRFGEQVRAHAEARNAKMRRDDMAATRAAFDSPDPAMWELGDLMIDLQEAGVRWPEIKRVREAIFEEVNNVSLR